MKKIVAMMLTLGILMSFYPAGSVLAEEEYINLAQIAEAEYASSGDSTSFPAANAFDGDKGKASSTRWSPTKVNGVWKDLWLQIDFGKQVTFNQAQVFQFRPRISKMEVQYSDTGLDGSWYSAYTYTNPDADANSTVNVQPAIVCDFSAVTARYLRIYINEAVNAPSVFELEVYGKLAIEDKIKNNVIEKLKTSINKQGLNQIVSDIGPLPSFLTNDDPAYQAAVSWESSDADIVNAETGKVVRSNKDVQVTLTANVTVAEPELVFVFPFELTILKEQRVAFGTNLALNKPSKGNNESETNPSSRAFDGNLGGSTYNTLGITPEKEPQYLQVDLGSKCFFNEIMIKEYGGHLVQYDIQYSDDGKAWESARGIVENDGDIHTHQLELTEARYVRLWVTDTAKAPAKIYEMEIRLKEESREEVVRYLAVSEIAERLTDEDSEHITIDFKEVPTAFQISDMELMTSVSWTAEPAGIINLTTGTVDRQQADTEVMLTAEIQTEGFDLFTQKFEFVVMAAEPETVLSKGQSFAGLSALPEGYGIVMGNESSVEFLNDRISLKKSESIETAVTGELSLGNGIYAEDFVPIEVVASAENASDGKIVLKSGNEQLGGVRFHGGSYTAFVGENTGRTFTYTQGTQLHLRANIDFVRNYIYLYELDENGDKKYLTAGAISNTAQVVDSISVSNNGTGSLSLYQVDIMAEMLAESIEKQLTFDKISEESIVAVNHDLKLFDSIAGYPVKWESSNEEIVNSATGKVTTGKGIQQVDLTAVVTCGETTITKVFHLTVGLQKQSQNKKITSSAKAADGSAVENMLDGNPDTMYQTEGSESSFTISVDLREKLPFNSVHLLESGTQGKITGYSVEVSSDGLNWITVKSGTEVTGEIPLNLCYERFVRFNVLTKEEGSVGIAEFGIYFAATDGEMTEYIFEQLQLPEVLTDGIRLPVKGLFDSVIGWTTDAEKIKIAADGTVAVTPGETNQIVTLHADIKYKDTVVRKEKKVSIAGKGSIQRPTRPSEGGSGSSGGRGIQGGTYTDNSGNQSENNKPQTQPYNMLGEEIKGHWAEKELSALIEQDIVRGDASGLHLQDAITRGEFMALLIRGLGIAPKEYKGGFADVKKNDWYADTIQAVVDAGLAQGNGESMNPNDVITREEMAKMLAATCEREGFTAVNENSMESFTDSNTISDWAQEAVCAMAELGLVNGFEDGTFRPKENSLREQAMVVIYRLLNLTK